MSFEEQLEKYGCGRIVVKSIGILTWAKLKHVARMNPKMALAMEDEGINMGGNPSEWFGSLQPIRKSRWIAAEVYKNDKWVEVESFQ